MIRGAEVENLEAAFDRPHRSLLFGSTMATWQSNGGGYRGHPGRTLPFSVRIAVPEFAGKLRRLKLIGVFARYAESGFEPTGSLGAVVQIGENSETPHRFDLIHGLHYSEATNLDPVERNLGDGTSVRTLGIGSLDEQEVRVDEVAFDLPEGPRPKVVIFRDLGSSASFVLVSAVFEGEPAEVCPFKAGGAGVAIAELPAVIRLGDRVRLETAINQMVSSLEASQDLDEARGEALTFLAVVTAATIELGAPRGAHRHQLDAARAFERLATPREVAAEAKVWVNRVCQPAFENRSAPSAHAIDEVLRYLERHYSRDLSDLQMAEQADLSTSHFRHLFREATGLPFHKYLMNLRLEKARALLQEGTVPVAEVARAVGFTSLPHFSRAFTQRFSVTPSRLRKGSS